MAKDFQQKRVYAWESKVLWPKYRTKTIHISKAQMFVDGVWMAMGWLYPPKVDLIPRPNARAFATGNRLELQLRTETPVFVILHELAHAATGTIHESDEGHGSDFMGIYLKLLDKIADIPLALTMFTLQSANVEYNLSAQTKADTYA